MRSCQISAQMRVCVHPSAEALTTVSATNVDLPGTLAGTPVCFAGRVNATPFPKHRNSLAHLLLMGFSGFHMKEHVSLSSGNLDMAGSGKCS